MLHVHVRVDAAGMTILPAASMTARRIRVGQRARRRNGGDGLALHADVTLGDALGRHHVAATNDQVEHGLPRSSFVGWVERQR
jgi:hypothetical protein